jgi:uncharacterized protein (DUF302 family)
LVPRWRRQPTHWSSSGWASGTQIDVKETLHKISVDFRLYLILGACHWKLAYQARTLEDKIGTMLPCNVIVRQRDGAWKFPQSIPQHR